MATHSSTLAWKILWIRKWQPTPVALPGKSHVQRSLVCYSPWGLKESDTTEQLHSLLGRNVMTNLDRILKSRDITLPTKVHLVKAMGFPVVMYGCESWTIKKAAAAAAVKLLESCLTLCDPIDGSPPGSAILGFSRQEH